MKLKYNKIQNREGLKLATTEVAIIAKRVKSKENYNENPCAVYKNQTL